MATELAPQEGDLSTMRREYGVRPLRREELLADPIEQFRRWFVEACNSGITEPNAMSLATVSAEGQPTLRTVLLKEFDERGFVFFTNLESRKACQILCNPQVALLFPWLQMQRQVSICGTAVRVSLTEVLTYFASRPVGSQLAALISPQSRPISARAILEMKWEEARRKFANGKIPLPGFWGGFRVRPREIEFWQGGEHRLHDRFSYKRQSDGDWVIEQLAP
jgi:pyridoxamine 5'-phosphate oxidase